jgi:hypothetical protein
MALPYENIRVDITRAQAHELIEKLITDEGGFRSEFETNTWEVLKRHGIDCEREALPEEITLPAPEDIQAFLTVLNERIVPEEASPFGFALMILAFGAMPVLIGDRPALDGTG